MVEKKEQVKKVQNKKTTLDKQTKKSMTSLSTVEFILVIVVGALIGTGLTLVSLRPTLKMAKYYLDGSDYKEIDSNVQTMLDVYNDIVNNYYKEVDAKEVVSGGIKGMLDSVGDVYTTYMDTTEYDSFNVTLNGGYEGIGVEISNIDNKIIVVGIFGDSPAVDAGLELGDIIISIDDKLGSDITSNDFATYVRNNSKKTFDLVIERNGERIEKTITKRPIVLKSVASKVFEEDGKKIGYIYMSIFATNTYNQFKKELQSLESKNIDSLILDLRNNSGGELKAATNIISLFVGKNKIIYQTEERDGKREVTYSSGKVDKTYPIVILTNKNTASASEVLAAALKDNLGATVIGENTFGKGTVQIMLTTKNGDQYKMTTRKWLTPNGNWINEEGIKPDIEVKLADDNDNQLEEAKKYLKK